MPTKAEKDRLRGRETTGHDWDGISELDTPLPQWWLYAFVASVVWALGFCLLYPSFPYGPGYFKGLLGYSQRGAVEAEMQEATAQQAGAMDRIRALPIAAIGKEPALAAIAMTAGRIAFANNCAACHGASGEGRKFYPVLADDDWLWGGRLEDIERTITFGVRSGHQEARQSSMPRFGDGMLGAVEIGQLADYVLSLTGRAAAGANMAAGGKLFAQNCAVCHGDKGEGKQAVGAPRLADPIWLYGNDRAAIIQQITAPRQGVMPAWVDRLGLATIKSLALYVHALGGGQ